MPYLNMKEIKWNPLRLVGIRFYKDIESDVLFVKVWSRRRRRIYR